MKKLKYSESEITKQIRNYLHLLKIPHFKHWGNPMSERGIPDIIAVIPPHGRMLLIEVKTPTGKLSQKQKDFLEEYRINGAVCIVARSAYDIVFRLNDLKYKEAQDMLLKNDFLREKRCDGE